MQNKKAELNLYLAETSGLENIELDEQTNIVYASRPLEGKPDHVLSIQTPVDFTKDWNLLIPLAIQLGVYPNIESEDQLVNSLIDLILNKKIKESNDEQF